MISGSLIGYIIVGLFLEVIVSCVCTVAFLFRLKYWVMKSLAYYSLGLTPVVLSRIPAETDWMAPYELDRASSFAARSDRDDYIAAHWLVREVASHVVGSVPERLMIGQVCSDCGGNHGKPFLRGHPHIHLSLSHTIGVVAAAVGEVAIAIDVESNVAERLDDSVLETVMTSSELSILRQVDIDPTSDALKEGGARRLWCAKECLIKLGLLTLDTMCVADLSRLLTPSHKHICRRYLGESMNVSFFDISDTSIDVHGIFACELDMTKCEFMPIAHGVSSIVRL